MKSKAFDVRIGPWPAGIVNAIPREHLPFMNREGSMSALYDAVNVDISRTGEVQRRPSWDEVAPANAHSIFEYAGTTWAVVDDDLVELLDGGTTLVKAAVGSRIAWTVLNNEPVFATNTGVYYLRNGAAVQVDGTEYDEDSDRVLAPLPGGTSIHAWNGRLVLARGTSLYFSEPLNYGYYDTATGVLPLGGRISWMLAVAGGIYACVRGDVYFLAGTVPEALALRKVDTKVWEGAGTLIPVSDSTEGQGDYLAVWFGTKGFVVGDQQGGIKRQQQGRIADLPQSKGYLSYTNGKVILVEENY